MDVRPPRTLLVQLEHGFKMQMSEAKQDQKSTLTIVACLYLCRSRHFVTNRQSVIPAKSDSQGHPYEIRYLVSARITQ